MNNNYISIDDFILLSKKSISTIRNFINEVKSYNSSLIKKIKNKYYLNKILLEFFKYPHRVSVSYFLYSLKKSHKVVTTTVQKEMFEPYHETLYNYLSSIDWKLFGHVSYENELPLEDCMYLFEKLFKRVKREFGPGINLFFTTEKNKDRRGYHNHFILSTPDDDVLWTIKKSIDAFFRKGNLGITLIKKYEQGKDGLKYIMKNIQVLNDGFELFRSGIQV